ncbi:hypothetical protein JB92DRAFT_3111976 [Gautieria morchelliformis]|nr:hypothetical protein JB92DRAFT_3111976 [Gautieria morchelliformis]
MTTQKRVKRQSSKPILGWLQKKLSGSGRAAREPVRAAKEPGRMTGERPRASTLQQLEIPPRHSDGNHIILNDDDVSHIGRSTPPRSSRSSTWSPSNPEADDDASIRPLPPTSPPSPAPSRSSSSFLSDPRTFKSVTASTKPTTLISIDLGTNGMAHIAQAPPTPITSPSTHSALPRLSTTSSNGVSNSASITFSALPSTSPASRSETHSPDHRAVQAPLHTSHHPRYNPRPSSPPQDNASVLTLASSAFAFPGGRMGGWVGDSQSQFALDGGSQHGELEVDEAQIEDASVRAIRPRSSRRGSWESEASGWSAKVAMVRERSLKASSWKAGPATDGDGSTELTGEELEGSEGKGVHGPSPLAANGFTSVEAVRISVEEEAQTPPAKETPEFKFVEEFEPYVESKDADDQTSAHAPEAQRTPTKKALSYQDEEVTQKVLQSSEDMGSVTATRTVSSTAEVATG